MRTLRGIKYLGLILLLSLSGCGKSNPPVGPDNGVVPFEVRLVPAEITPPQNAQVKLFATFPQFDQLDGKQVYFSSSSGGGFFNNDSSRINLQAPDQSNLSPSVWYTYTGTAHNLVDSVKAEVVDLYGHTLDWNYGLILVH